MRILVQRVKEATVTIDESIAGEIGQGMLIFLGVSQSDTKEVADKMIRKLVGLRIFEDQEGKTNLDLKSINGSMLIVSQFTLYADCKKGNRPSFINAALPDPARQIYEYMIAECQKFVENVQTGSFGADMQVSLTNDGPFTIMLDSEEICGTNSNAVK